VETGGAAAGAEAGAVEPASTGRVEDPQWFFGLAEPHLSILREVVGHVLRYTEARGDLPQMIWNSTTWWMLPSRVPTASS
jgi:hypothetical protein